MAYPLVNHTSLAKLAINFTCRSRDSSPNVYSSPVSFSKYKGNVVLVQNVATL